MFTFNFKNRKKCLPGLVLFFTVITVGCSEKKKTEEVSDEVVLKIGYSEITRYEFERNKKRTFESGRGMTYEQWLAGVIDDTYILADALDKKYDTIANINKQVDYVAYSMVGQVEGYLWEKTVTPRLRFSNSDLRGVYKKRNKIYQIAICIIDDHNLVNRLIGSHDVISIAQFDEIKKISDTCKFISFYSLETFYPFDNLAFFKDEIYNLKPGQIVRYNTQNQTYIVHLVKIEDKQQGSFAKEKTKLQEILKQATETTIIEEKQHEIYSKAEIFYNEKAINDLFLLLSESHDKSPVRAPGNPADTLITYNFNNIRAPFLIKQFLEMYYYNATIYLIKEKKQLKPVLDEYVLELYLFNEAESIGVTKDKKYLLDRRNFKNRLMIDQYQQNELMQKVTVSGDEILDYYNQNTKNYTESVTSYVTVFSFRGSDDAYKNYNHIKQKLATEGPDCFSDTSKMEGLISIQLNFPVTRNNKNLSTDVINQIFNCQKARLSMPIQNNNSSIIFIKTGEEGQRLKSFDEVKESVFRTIQSKKFEVIKNERLLQLKNKYPVTVKKI